MLLILRFDFCLSLFTMFCNFIQLTLEQVQYAIRNLHFVLDCYILEGFV